MSLIKKNSKRFLLTLLLTFIFLLTNFVSDSILIFEPFNNTEIVYAKPKSSSFKSSSFKSSSNKSSKKTSGGYKSSSFSNSNKGKSSASKNFSSGSFSTSKKNNTTNDNEINKDTSTKNNSNNKEYKNSNENPNFSLDDLAYGLSRIRYSRGYYGNSGFSLSTVISLAIIFIIIIILIKIYLNKRKY